MYIRRKVYSVFEDENGEIRYFSTNEIMNEEDYIENLYSEDYIDDYAAEKLFARAVKTDAVVRGQELAKKNAAKIQALNAERKAAIEALRKKGGRNLDGRIDALNAQYDAKLASLKESFKGNLGARGVAKAKAAEDAALVGKGSFKKVESRAKATMAKNKVADFLKSKGGKAAILGAAGAAGIGAGYGISRLAARRSNNDEE